MAFSVRRWRVMAILAFVVVSGLYFFINAAPLDTSPSTTFQYSKTAQTPLKDSSQVHWSKLPDRYPVTSLIPLPTGNPAAIPKIQAKPAAEDADAKAERLRRLEAVKESFIHSWQGYKAHAWLKDEVIPIAGGYRDTFGGWAASLVDALDTLWIMGMTDEFEMAVKAVKDIDFTTTDSDVINVFETTIRYMGGFLAAYDISDAKYPILLEKAVEVGEMLMSVFDTPNRMPITRWSWKSYMTGGKQEAPKAMLVSEIGSLTLEFTRLAQLTGASKYYDAIQRVSDEFEKSQMTTKLPGMWPVVIDASIPKFDGDSGFTLGGMSDSLYEYFPKQYMMLGGLLEQPRKLYEGFIEVAKEHLFFKPLNLRNQDILLSGDVQAIEPDRVRLTPRSQHLTCFAGGMLGIAGKIFNRPDDLQIAQQLTDGCVWAYDMHPTGIAPEIFTVIPCKKDDTCFWSEEKWWEGIEAVPAKVGAENFVEEVKKAIDLRRLAHGFVAYPDRKYILRPEAIESVFIMYRITGDVEWQNKAWRMFEHIERACRTGIASSAIFDVTANKPQKSDSMESFWLAETLKYFYLIFAEPNLVSLDEYVLNTEAHPLKRPTQSV